MIVFLKAKVVSFWKATQVELQGSYSVDRVQDLFAYSNKTSSLRVFLIPLATPLPSLLLITSVDWMPLRPAAEGIHANYLFFVRAFVSFWIATMMTYVQFKHIVVMMPLTTMQIVGVSVIVACITVSILYLLALNIGFPLPFSSIFVSPAWLLLIVIPLFSWMRRARNDPEVWPLVINALKVMTCQEILVLTYPTYFYIFTTIPGNWKTSFAVLLPVMKLVLRNVMAETVAHLNDEIPEIVILNVEVFSALFVAYCMQNTPSLQTTLVLMVADVLQMSASIYDVEFVIRRLKTLRRKFFKVARGQQNDRKKSEFNIAQDIFNRHTSSHLSSAGKFSPLPKSLLKFSASVEPLNAQDVKTCGQQILPFPLEPHVKKTRVGPNKNDLNSELAGYLEFQYVEELRRVLYITEFVVLLNYVEVVVPLIFSVYLMIMYHLPNRAYYEQMIRMDHNQLRHTVFNLLLYSGLQLVSLFTLNLVLWRKMRFSVFRQLSFVLERQCSRVQNRLIFWVFYNVQSSLQHCGFDYTFRFSWLRGNHSS